MKPNSIGILVLAFVLGVSVCSLAEEFLLTRDGKPAAIIVLSKNPTRAAQLGAVELRQHVRKITGAELPIVMEDQPVQGRRILVGESAAARSLGFSSRDLKSEEYLIRFQPDALVLIGKDDPSGAADFHWAAGRFGQALSFDGVDDCLWVPHCGFSDDVGTMEAWVWIPAQPQETESTILRIDGQKPWSYHILRRTPKQSTFNYTVYDGKKGSSVTSKQVSEGWHHVMATHDAQKGVIELFVDGVSQGTARFTRTTCAGAALNIGGLSLRQSGQSRVSNPFCGLIDEVRVSSIVRRPNAAAVSSPFTPDPHTTLLMHFDEGSGTPLDSSGHVPYINPPALFEDKGTLYAVYDFLERFCDVRWYAPGEIGTVCPSTATLKVEGTEIRRVPAMVTRWIAPSPLYMPTPEQVLPHVDVTLWMLRMRLGGYRFVANHSFYGYYDRFLKTHPDWFAQGYQGRPPQMCYTNPDFIQQVIQDARDYFDGKPPHPGAVVMGDSFALVPMDTGQWCKCPRCQAELDMAEENNPQFNRGLARNYIWGFVNKVAAEVRKTHPNKWLTALAYATYAYYPTKIEIEPNVAVQLCLHTRNWWTPSMEKNDIKVLNQWVQREGKRRPIYLWLYYCFPALQGKYAAYKVFPGFFAHTVVKQMKMFHKAGVRGIFMEHSGEFQHTFLLDQVEMYVTWKLADDPTLDGDKLIDEFFTRYYGAAAGPMQALYNRIEETFSNPANYPESIQKSPGHHHQTEELAWKYLGTPARMEVFGRLMDEAKKAAQSDVEKRRVSFFEEGIWKPMLEGAAKYAERQRARSQPPPKVKVRVLPVPARGDPGKVDWSKATPLGRWSTLAGDLTHRTISARLAHDGQYLYVELQEVLDPGTLVSAPDIWSGDDWELFFAWKREKPYRQIAVSPSNKWESLEHRAGVAAWDSGARVTSITTMPNRWVVRMAVPLDRLLPGGVKPGAKFYANFFRASPGLSELLGWSPTFSGGFHEPARMGEVTLE